MQCKSLSPELMVAVTSRPSTATVFLWGSCATTRRPLDLGSYGNTTGMEYLFSSFAQQANALFDDNCTYRRYSRCGVLEMMLTLV